MRQGTITSVKIADSVEYIDDWAFYSSNIRNLSFGENSKLKGLSGIAFDGLPTAKIIIPESVEMVGNGLHSTTTVLNAKGHTFYCTETQINKGLCGEAAIKYEHDGDKFIVYEGDKIQGIYDSYKAISDDVVTESFYTKKDREGNPIAVYDGRGNLQSSYSYNPDGSIKTYDKNGKLVDIRGKRIFTVEEASSLVTGKNTFTIRYR